MHARVLVPRVLVVAATPRRAQAQNMQRVLLAVALFQSCSSFEPKSVYDNGARRRALEAFPSPSFPSPGLE